MDGPTAVPVAAQTPLGNTPKHRRASRRAKKLPIGPSNLRMTSVDYSAAKVVLITPFLLGIQVLIKGLQLPVARRGTPSSREVPVACLV